MLFLDTTTRKIQVLLSGAPATTNPVCVASWADLTTSAITPASNTASTNGSTAVDLVAAPAASTQRQLKYLSVFNVDTANVTVTVRLNDNATLYKLIQVTLTPGQSLVYSSESGWQIITQAAGQIAGTATNDDAAAGNVGEFISSTVLAGSEISLTSATPANITSISLPPGDYDVFGSVVIDPAGGTTTTLVRGWISSVSAAAPTEPNNGGSFRIQGISFVGGQFVGSVGTQRISLAATTTYYLTAFSTFSGSTSAAFGFIGARRVR